MSCCDLRGRFWLRGQGVLGTLRQHSSDSLSQAQGTAQTSGRCLRPVPAHLPLPSLLLPCGLQGPFLSWFHLACVAAAGTRVQLETSSKETHFSNSVAKRTLPPLLAHAAPPGPWRRGCWQWAGQGRCHPALGCHLCGGHCGSGPILSFGVFDSQAQVLRPSLPRSVLWVCAHMVLRFRDGVAVS